MLSDRVAVRGRAKLIQPALFSGRGTVLIGDDVVIGTRNSPFLYSGYSYIEARQETAIVRFGNRVWTNNNLVIISDNSVISIGDDVLIGLGVEIYGSDFHALDPNARRTELARSGPVRIGDNVWVGSRVCILKGVSIGRNSVIGAGSVVVDGIPENVLAAGIPAKVVRELK